MASEYELRAKYRAARLETSLECGPARAAEMAKRLTYLGDDDFDSYARHSAETLTGMRVRAGSAPAQTPDRTARRERVTAAVSDYLDAVFGLDEEGDAGVRR